jgi:hypothetical protein
MITGSTANPSSPDHVSDVEPQEEPNGPAAAPATTPKTTRFAPVAEPKTQQFTGRATEKEAEKIKKALAANGGIDIVRFTLKAISAFETDFLTSIKTK